MTRPLPLLDHVRDDAQLGSWCPKLCTFACPVHAATGRDDAVPWSFHRVVTDLVDGRRDVAEVIGHVDACSGCLACQVPCEFDLDVPAEVRAGRAVVGPTEPAAVAAVEQVAGGARVDLGDAPGPTPARAGQVAGTVLWVGCGDTTSTVRASVALLEAAGHEVTVAADGCCGGLADDLGAPPIGDERRAALEHLGQATTVVARDPHCLASLSRVSDRVADLWSVLAEAGDDLQLAGEPFTATYQDPCLLARGASGPTPARDLLARADITVVDPEFSGREVACSGAGMGLPLVDPDAADRTARRRRAHLDDTGVPVVTACGRSAALLDRVGAGSTDLAVLLASRLTRPPQPTEPSS